MGRQSLVVMGIAITVIQGCAMERTVSTVETDTRPCVANYQTEGEFWTGKQFKTFQDFPRVSPAIAYKSVGAAIASGGYQITSSNEALGIISATQAVSYSSGGKTVPLNAVVTNSPGGGARVELRFSLSGGLAASADVVQDQFCKILSSVFTGTAKSDGGVAVSKPAVANTPANATESKTATTKPKTNAAKPKPATIEKTTGTGL